MSKVRSVHIVKCFLSDDNFDMLGNFQEKRYHDIEFNVENSRALSNRSNTNTLGSTNKGRKKTETYFFCRLHARG